MGPARYWTTRAIDSRGSGTWCPTDGVLPGAEAPPPRRWADGDDHRHRARLSRKARRTTTLTPPEESGGGGGEEWMEVFRRHDLAGDTRARGSRPGTSRMGARFATRRSRVSRVLGHRRSSRAGALREELCARGLHCRTTRGSQIGVRLEALVRVNTAGLRIGVGPRGLNVAEATRPLRVRQAHDRPADAFGGPAGPRSTQYGRYTCGQSWRSTG